MKKLFVASFAAASLIGATAAFAEGILTDSKGMTVYTYDKDKGKTSSCYGSCAANWPPYTVHAGEKMGEGWSSFRRKTGAQQWTYDGHPLYHFGEDKKAGDTLGDGKGGVWHVVKTK